MNKLLLAFLFFFSGLFIGCSLKKSPANTPEQLTEKKEVRKEVVQQPPLDLPPLKAIEPQIRMLGYSKEDNRIFVLKEGDTIYTGEYFKLYWCANLESYLYIIHFDNKGSMDLLFPYTLSKNSHKIEGNKTYSFPEDQKTWITWDTTKGIEVFYLIASKSRIDNIDQLIESQFTKQTAQKDDKFFSSLEQSLINEKYGSKGLGGHEEKKEKTEKVEKTVLTFESFKNLLAEKLDSLKKKKSDKSPMYLTGSFSSKGLGAMEQLDITTIDESTPESTKISAIGELAPELLISKNSEIFIKKIVLIHE